MVITSLQLSQMVVGLGVQYVLWLNVEKSDCHTDMNHVLAGLCMYGSYFLLFLDYFLGAYVRGPVKQLLHLPRLSPTHSNSLQLSTPLPLLTPNLLPKFKF